MRWWVQSCHRIFFDKVKKDNKMKKCKTFKVQIVTMLVITCMLSSCASYTTIRSRPGGATVYANNVRLGVTPVRYSDTAISGTVTPIRLKKEGYRDLNTIIRKDQFKIGPCIGGWFVIFPFIWILGYQDVYEFELEPAPDRNQ